MQAVLHYVAFVTVLRWDVVDFRPAQYTLSLYLAMHVRMCKQLTMHMYCANQSYH